MKTVKTNKNIESILNVTKNVIKESTEFNDYYKKKDNNLYHNQLPLLMQRSRIREALYFKNKNEIQDLILHKTVAEEQNSNENIIQDEEEKNLYSNNSLTEIRKLQVRSKKLPPLCPFYNKKGDLLPEVVYTSKALLSNLDSDSKFNLSNINFGNIFPNWHYLTPMNKNKIKNINLYENIEINYEEFQNEVLFDKKYETLKYNYSDIYDRKKYYKEYINNSIEEIIKLTSESQLIEEGNPIIENQESKKEKIFEWGKNKKNISLSLNSINIKIKSIQDDTPVFEYALPLNLIPLFYYKDFEKFKIFIMALIHYDEKSKKFELDQNIYLTINNLLTNCKELKTKFDIFDEIEETEDKIYPNSELKKAVSVGIGKNFSKNLAKSMMNIGSGKSNNLFAGTNVDIILKKKVEKKTIKLYPKKEKEESFLLFNDFNFYWKVKDNLYQVCVETPLIIFTIPSYNIIIKQFIDYELLFYLFSNKFNLWDFYAIKYISSFKIFRIILSKIASLNQKKNINIFLEKPKIKYYDLTDEQVINIITMDNTLNKKANKITNLPEFEKIEEEDKEHNSSSEEENAKKEMNKASTVQTVQTEETIKPNNINEKKGRSKNNNTIIEQKCFKAIVTVTDLEANKANEYVIHFNYKQFSKFKYIEKYMNKITFLIKFIDVNYEKSTIRFDYESLNLFNEKDWISQLERYNCNLSLKIDSNISNIITPKIIQEKKIKMSPKKSKNKNIKSSTITKEEEKMLLNNNLNNNPNKAEFVGDSNKKILSVEIKESTIVLKNLENNGKMKYRKFNILKEDENKLILNKKNMIELVNNLCDLCQEYIKKDNEKKAESVKSSEKNLYSSYNKKLVK